MAGLLTYPENGLIPYSAQGRALADRVNEEVLAGLDGPEHRPLDERCLASMVYPPMRPLPIELPITIVQNADHMTLFMEDAAGFRMIHIGDSEGSDARRAYQGYSTAAWEGSMSPTRYSPVPIL